MKVSSHPAQVVTPNKDKERGSRFQTFKTKAIKPTRNYSLLKFLMKIKQHFIDSVVFYFLFILHFFVSLEFMNSLFNFHNYALIEM
jgi:hypothetical protein